MGDRFYFKVKHNAGYPESNLRKAPYIGDCKACGLMLMRGDTVCPRCNAEVPA